MNPRPGIRRPFLGVRRGNSGFPFLFRLIGGLLCLCLLQAAEPATPPPADQAALIRKLMERIDALEAAQATRAQAADLIGLLAKAVTA